MLLDGISGELKEIPEALMAEDRNVARRQVLLDVAAELAAAPG